MFLRINFRSGEKWIIEKFIIILRGLQPADNRVYSYKNTHVYRKIRIVTDDRKLYQLLIKHRLFQYLLNAIEICFFFLRKTYSM